MLSLRIRNLCSGAEPLTNGSGSRRPKNLRIRIAGSYLGDIAVLDLARLVNILPLDPLASQAAAR
jgi:hypothetical protein